MSLHDEIAEICEDNETLYKLLRDSYLLAAELTELGAAWVGVDDSVDRWVANRKDYLAAIQRLADYSELTFQDVCDEITDVWSKILGHENYDIDYLRRLTGDDWVEVRAWLGEDYCDVRLAECDGTRYYEDPETDEIWAARNGVDTSHMVYVGMGRSVVGAWRNLSKVNIQSAGPDSGRKAALCYLASQVDMLGDDDTVDAWWNRLKEIVF